MKNCYFKSSWTFLIVYNIINVRCQPPRHQRDAPFNCKSNGDYQDPNSVSEYWHCDVDAEGGFVAVRKRCPEEQVFDGTQRACIAKRAQFVPNPALKVALPYVFAKVELKPPTVFENRPYGGTSADNEKNNFRRMSSSFTDRPEPAEMGVAYKTSPNPKDCFSFYLYYAKRDAADSYDRLLLQCPQGTAFDENLQKCTKRAMAKCMCKDQMNAEKLAALRKENNKRYDGFDRLRTNKKFRDSDIFQKRHTALKGNAGETKRNCPPHRGGLGGGGGAGQSSGRCPTRGGHEKNQQETDDLFQKRNADLTEPEQIHFSNAGANCPCGGGGGGHAPNCPSVRDNVFSEIQKVRVKILGDVDAFQKRDAPFSSGNENPGKKGLNCPCGGGGGGHSSDCPSGGGNTLYGIDNLRKEDDVTFQKRDASLLSGEVNSQNAAAGCPCGGGGGGHAPNCPSSGVNTLMGIEKDRTSKLASSEDLQKRDANIKDNLRDTGCPCGGGQGGHAPDCHYGGRERMEDNVKLQGSKITRSAGVLDETAANSEKSYAEVHSKGESGLNCPCGEGAGGGGGGHAADCPSGEGNALPAAGNVYAGRQIRETNSLLQKSDGDFEGSSIKDNVGVNCPCGGGGGGHTANCPHNRKREISDDFGGVRISRDVGNTSEKRNGDLKASYAKGNVANGPNG